MTKNMTEGRPLGLVLRFALPMLLGAAFQQLYNVVDMLVVGNVVGSRALAAVGATGSTTFLAMSLMMGLTNGYTSVAARYFGGNNGEMLKKTFAGTAYLSLISAVVMTAAGVFGARPLMLMLQTPEDIINDSVIYIQICIGGGIGMVIYNGASSVLRAVGDSRTPLLFLIMTSLLNVALDLLFVLVFGLGVAGVGIATVISQCISAAACLVYMRRKFEIFRLTRGDFQVPWEINGKILAIGLPSALQLVLLAIGDMTITGVVNSAGTDAVAAYSTGSRIMSFVMMFCMQIATAFSIFAGQNFGAGEITRIKKGFRDAAVVTVCLSLVVTGAIFLFGDFLVRLFISSGDAHVEAVVPIARDCLRVYAAFFFVLGPIWLYNATLRGMGDVVIPFVSGITELCAKVAFSIILFGVFGVQGIWFANPAAWVLGIIPSIIRFHSGGWEKGKR